MNISAKEPENRALERETAKESGGEAESAVGKEADVPNICEALRILGAKWSFMVIAQLSRGPQRFKELLRNAQVIKTQSLTDALRHLEKTGVVLREVFPTVPVTVVYSLTEKGHDFRRVLAEMDDWAAKWSRADSAVN